MGVVTPIGQNIPTFQKALFTGKTQFGYLKRPGREGSKPFLGAELPDIEARSILPQYGSLLRTASWSTQNAAIAVSEAWQDAKLSSNEVNPERIGIVVGGSNFQQRYQEQIWQRYAEKPEFLKPSYGVTFWDTDQVSLLSQCFQITGESYSVGGASAGGSISIIHAARQIQLGITDVSIVVGPLFDISRWECQGLKNLGAMGSERFADSPQLACRPFDRDRDGFIYGECCGVVILEQADHAKQRGVDSYGELIGWGFSLEGKRGPEPSKKAEEQSMNTALAMAELKPARIDYVNTHGTGSPLGDKTEAAALKSVGLSHCLVNATKSLTGHGLTAAGVVELISTLLQMKEGFCHPTHNLVNPIDAEINWVKEEVVKANIEYAISNSFAFGGINTALVVRESR